MLPAIIEKADMEKFISGIIKSRRLIAPVAKEERWCAFEEISSSHDVRLDYTTSLLPPGKKYLYPPCDTILQIKLTGEKPEAKPSLEGEPLVLFGVHPCDLIAISLLDVVMSEGHKDPYYLARRTSTILVGLNCLQPCDDKQFCLDMGSLFPTNGSYDLFLTDIGDCYFVEIGTERGHQLLESSSTSVAAATNDHFVARQQAEQNKRDSFAYKLPFDVKYLPEILESAYDSHREEMLLVRDLHGGLPHLLLLRGVRGT